MSIRAKRSLKRGRAGVPILLVNMNTLRRRSQIADALALPGSPSLLEKRTLKALGGRMLETAKVQCPLHNVNVNSVSSVEKVGERIKLAASKWSQAVPANGNQRLEL